MTISLPAVEERAKRGQGGVARGALAADVRGALAGLSLAFLRRRRPPRGDGTLADGEAGVALAHAALARIFPDSGHAAAARRSLAYAVRGLTGQLGPGLLEGCTGVAWAAQVLARAGLSPARSDVQGQVLEALVGYVGQRRQWAGHYDLASGLVGFGVYALECLPHPTAERLAELVVRRLAEAGERLPGGITWRWRPRASSRTWAESPPVWNLGLAHGVPGVIAFLGRACGMGVDVRTARRLLRGAVAWLLARELAPRSLSCFARQAGVEGAEGVDEPARLGWCYGDAGVAAALLVAGVDADEPGWVAQALRIARRAAARPWKTSGVVDASVCHGAAGLGHIFHRAYIQTGEGALARAARRWFRRCLSMRTEGYFGGFYALEPGRNGVVVRAPAAGFLSGAAGVAMAFVAAVSGGDAAAWWDRSILLSGNPA